MKKITILLALALVVALTLPAVAEVEEVTVGGSIVIRGQLQTPGVGVQPAEAFDIDGNAATTTDRFVIGERAASFDKDIESLDWITQRTRVNVDAKLSGNVRGFVELQTFDFWGSDGDDAVEGDDANAFLEDPFVSDELGFGFTAGSGSDSVDLYQAYIEMNNIGDYPFMVRAGRQELVYGREWIIGNNDAGVNFSGLAFDAIKGSYESDLLRVDAWASKLAEFTSPNFVPNQEEDGDIDLYGVYATYKGIENMAIDAYWMMMRSGVANPSDDTTQLHAVGARIAGGLGLLGGTLDYNVEGAYQFGKNGVGTVTDPTDSGDIQAWAINAMAGYTFSEVTWTPRLEAEYAFFSGDDDFQDADTEEFTRMFSDVHYGELNIGGDLDQNVTNLHIVRVGASAVPVEKLALKADLLWFLLAEDEADGLAKVFGMPQIENVAGSAFSTVGEEDGVGMELDVVADYQYTEDLNLRAGWAHFFADDATENAWGNGEDDDIDYVYVQAALLF